MVVIFIGLSACASQVKNTTDDLQSVAAVKEAELRNRFQQGLSYQNEGDYDEAEVIYQSLLDEDSQLINPMVNLGVIAVKSNRLAVAKDYFESVIQLAPKHLLSLNYLGYISRELGEFDQAESYYRKILDLDPNNVLAIRNLGILLDLYRGRLAEALVLYEKYQHLLAEPDPKIKDWIFDTKNRLKAK